jgi:large subunit ribosomal protein L21
MPYAIISLGGKQHRVQEGERLIVDRLAVDEGATFNPAVLLVGGDGETSLDGAGAEVVARVVKHDLGPKIRIGKYRRRTGYRRHNGHRSRITQIEIQSIGAAQAKSARRRKKADESATSEEGSE